MNNNNDKITLKEIISLLIYFPLYFFRKKRKPIEKELEPETEVQEELVETDDKHIQRLTLLDFAKYYIALKQSKKSDWLDKFGWIIVTCFVLFLIFFV